ncbi:MAG: GatB/YqeY domain-containing protein [Bacteroidetes bacterium]|nr:GatB/YqeY domain-containing protein [Bacteroidota bacterium]MBP7398146.1 GatB/YqeY domain-containing protein [Chitinophagales bacterium]MBK7108146.1 GatB/YqeY domain-containing protein [Bacteroidota bacterium]MBK8486421.1 GatB/YqeY domain-containing protein [Bacteroidota bacterium]MBK8683201.1 GatB/YqeY domain-containing protein [Bacteroidota bacterium]
MQLVDTINEDIKQAMRNKDEAALRALRGIKSALLIAKTEKGASDIIAPEKELQILQKLVKQRKESLEIYQTQNRADLAKIEEEEIAVIEKYLPAQMSADALRESLQQIIQQVGATSAADIGKVMGAASKQLAGKADGKTISAMVKELLAP